MFPEAPLVLIPSGEVTPRVAPALSVNVPPPINTVPGVAICKVVPLLTIKLIVFVIAHPLV